MIQVQFNSQKLENSIASLIDLPNVLTEVETKHLPEGSFIRDVLLDGESLVSNGYLDLQSVSADRLEQAHNINIISRTLKEVTLEAIQGARAYLAGLATPISLIALQFNSGQFEKAFSNLSVLLDGISNLISLVGSLEAGFGLDCGSIIARRAPVTTHVKDLQCRLQELVQAQARKDAVAIADLLDYELRPRMELWGDIFAAFQEKLDASALPA